MSIGLRLDLKQSQQLVMTPQLQQAIKLLQMSNLELADFVAGEAERNPLLQVEGAAAPPGAGEAAPERRAAEAAGPDASMDDEGFEASGLETDFADDTPTARAPAARSRSGGASGSAPSGGASPGAESGYDIDQAPGRPVTLREHLLAQIGQARAAPAVRLLARLLAEDLDEHGMLRADPAALAARLGASAAQADAALALLQGCEPTGVGARSLGECLALQLAERDRLDPAMRRLVENLELLELGQHKRLRALCGVDAEDFADMLAELRRLDPRPCAGFGREPAETLVPDLLLSRAPDGTPDGAWQVELNADTLPKVLIDNRYAARIGGLNDEAESFIQGCRAEANWLIRSMDQRARSILAVASAIVRHQGRFFDEGVAGLRPLTLAMVAETAGLHESTASRVTSNKYIATERGIFELKFFFTNAVGADGATAEAIRHRIRRMVDAESPSAILSDDEIVERLQIDGIEVARRTVAKYRKALGIGSSVERRRMKALIAEV